MASEYVDITDQKYTRWLKIIATTRLCIKIGWMMLCCVCMIVLTLAVEPYITGEVEFDPLPMTLSQFEITIGFIVIIMMLAKAAGGLR